MKIFKFFSTLALLIIAFSANIQADGRKANEFMATLGSPTKTTSSTDPDLVSKMYDNTISASALTSQHQATDSLAQSVKDYANKNNKVHGGKANKAINDLSNNIKADSNRLKSHITKIQSYTNSIATETQKANEYLKPRLKARENQLLKTRSAIEKDEPTSVKAKKEKKIAAANANPKKEKPVRVKKEREVKVKPAKIVSQPVQKQKPIKQPKASKNSIPKQPKAPKAKKQSKVQNIDEAGDENF